MPAGLIDAGTQVTGLPQVTSTAYRFLRTNTVSGPHGATADLSSAGAGKVITFSNSPAGLVAGRYVYLSRGTGTAEAVLITASTCPIDGGTSGTITVTTANTHTGAWAVSSATEGIQEACEVVAPIRGTVSVPVNASGYTMLAPLVVPKYVTLLGHLDNVHRSQGDVSFGSPSSLGYLPGTTLRITLGAGTGAGQAITAKDGCTINGFVFYYPNQENDATPVQYPPTIRLDTSEITSHVKIYNCYGVNPWFFIDATHEHSRLHLRNVYMHPINTGILIGVAPDGDLLEDVYIVGIWYETSLAITPIVQYMDANGTAIKIHKADAIQLENVVVYGYKYGIYLDGTAINDNAGNPQVRSYGFSNGYSTDATQYALYIVNDAIAASGWTFNGGSFSAHNRTTPSSYVAQSIYSIGNTSGWLRVFGSTISGINTGTLNLVRNDGLAMQFVACNFFAWGNYLNAPALIVSGIGTITCLGGYFTGAASGAQIVEYDDPFAGPPVRFLGTGFGIPFSQNNTTVTPAPQTVLLGARDSNGEAVKLAALNLYQGAATAAAGAVTLNAVAGTITTESLTTAAGAAYTLTFTNSQILGTSLIIPIVTLGTSTQGVPVVITVTAGSGSATIVVRNDHGSLAFNGTLKIQFLLIGGA